MKERIEVIDYKYKIVGWTFALFLILGLLAPISGIDYVHCLKDPTISSMWQNATSNFQNGILGHFFIYFFCANKTLFAFVFAFFMALLVYICNGFLGTIQKKYYYMFPLLFLLFTNYLFFSESYFSITYAIQYTIPAILIFYLIYSYYKEPRISFSTQGVISWALLFLLLPQISLFGGTLLLFASLFLFFYSKKAFKKFPFHYLLFFLLGIISLGCAFLQQDLFKEIPNAITISFTSLALVEERISSFLSYTFTRNVLVELFTLIPVNIYLYQKVKDRTYTRLIMVAFNLIPIFNIICQFSLLIPVNMELIISQYSGIFSCDKWYFLFYFILYFILYVKSITYFIEERKLKNFLLFLTLSGMASQLFILVRPLWMDTNSTYYTFANILVLCVLLVKMGLPLYTKILRVVFGLSIIYFIGIFGLISYYDYGRVAYIKEQLAADDKTIIVKALPIRYIYGYNPIYYEDVELFRKYYNIPEEKKISVKYIGVFEEIEKNVKK